MAIETTEYLEMLSRLIRRAGERCAEADEWELSMLLDLGPQLENAYQVAVDGMRARGMSWAYIATATHTTRQAAQMRWGKQKAPVSE